MHNFRKGVICAVVLTFVIAILTMPLAFADDIKSKYDNLVEMENYILHPMTGKPMYKKQEFSQNDINRLVRLVYKEAGNQGFDGQVAVVAVILNRMRATESDFAKQNSITDVIFHPRAFADISNVTFEEADAEGTCFDAVMAALNHYDPTEELLWAEAERLGLDPEVYASGGALYFYNPDFTGEEELARRANIKCQVQIGSHVFYKVWDR